MNPDSLPKADFVWWWCVSHQQCNAAFVLAFMSRKWSLSLLQRQVSIYASWMSPYTCPLHGYIDLWALKLSDGVGERAKTEWCESVNHVRKRPVSGVVLWVDFSVLILLVGHQVTWPVENLLHRFSVEGSGSARSNSGNRKPVKQNRLSAYIEMLF